MKPRFRFLPGRGWLYIGAGHTAGFYRDLDAAWRAIFPARHWPTQLSNELTGGQCFD